MAFEISSVSFKFLGFSVVEVGGLFEAVIERRFEGVEVVSGVAHVGGRSLPWKVEKPVGRVIGFSVEIRGVLHEAASFAELVEIIESLP